MPKPRWAGRKVGIALANDLELRRDGGRTRPRRRALARRCLRWFVRLYCFFRLCPRLWFGPHDYDVRSGQAGGPKLGFKSPQPTLDLTERRCATAEPFRTFILGDRLHLSEAVRPGFRFRPGWQLHSDRPHNGPTQAMFGDRYRDRYDGLDRPAILRRTRESPLWHGGLNGACKSRITHASVHNPVCLAPVAVQDHQRRDVSDETRAAEFLGIDDHGWRGNHRQRIELVRRHGPGRNDKTLGRKCNVRDECQAKN